MKLHALFLSTLLAIAGCEKSSNVTALQDETTGLANQYKARFDELSRRIALLEQRGRSMVSIGQPQGLNDVRKLFLDTNKRLAELRTVTSQVPTAISNAQTAQHPRAELIKLMGQTRQTLHKGETEVNANIDAVEQWLAYVDYRPRVAAAEPLPAPPVPEPKPEDLPENPGQMKKDPGAPGNAPKADAPKADAPKADAPKADVPKVEPKKDGSGSAR